MRKLSELLEVCKTIESNYFNKNGICMGLCITSTEAFTNESGFEEDYFNKEERILLSGYIDKHIGLYRAENEWFGAYAWSQRDLQSRLDWLDYHINLNNLNIDEDDFNSFSDTIGNALDKWDLSKIEVLKYYESLPKDIKYEIELYGASDTPTRENIYLWLKKKYINLNKDD